MTQSLSPHHCVPTVACLFFSAVLLVSVFNVRAGDITYNIVNYPANEIDYNTAEQDSLSGTIITDGALGVLSTTDIVGGTITIANPTFGATTIPIPAADYLQIVSLTASPTQLTLPVGGCFEYLHDDQLPYGLVIYSNSYGNPPNSFFYAQYLRPQESQMNGVLHYLPSPRPSPMAFP